MFPKSTQLHLTPARDRDVGVPDPREGGHYISEDLFKRKLLAAAMYEWSRS
jgi:hypothetical protein